MATTRKNVSTTIVKKKLEPKNDATTYIESLTQAELENTSGKCVLIDPGRCDLLYCMKETSTVLKKDLLIFRKTNRSKRSRHFKILRKVTKPNVIKNAEAILANTKSSTVDVGKFVEYIKTRSSVEKVMTEYYRNETQKSEEIYFPDSHFNFKVNDKGNLYFGNLYVTKIEDPLPDNLTISQLYATYLRIMQQQKHIYKWLNNVVKTEVLEIASEMFANDQESLRQRASKLLEKLQALPFRKLKFSSKLYYDQNDEKLVRNLKKKFGLDAVLVLGNWFAPNNKYHEPTRNKGLISMLKKNGLTVHIIDEFKTSSKCPKCEEDLESFKIITNPCPYRRLRSPTVKCHGLLRGKNPECLVKEAQRTLWNRDLAAVLNFRKILISLRNTGARPIVFSRKPALKNI